MDDVRPVPPTPPSSRPAAPGVIHQRFARTKRRLRVYTVLGVCLGCVHLASALLMASTDTASPTYVLLGLFFNAYYVPHAILSRARWPAVLATALAATFFPIWGIVTSGIGFYALGPFVTSCLWSTALLLTWKDWAAPIVGCGAGAGANVGMWALIVGGAEGAWTLTVAPAAIWHLAMPIGCELLARRRLDRLTPPVPPPIADTTDVARAGSAAPGSQESPS